MKKSFIILIVLILLGVAGFFALKFFTGSKELDKRAWEKGYYFTYGTNDNYLNPDGDCVDFETLKDIKCQKAHGLVWYDDQQNTLLNIPMVSLNVEMGNGKYKTVFSATTSEYKDTMNNKKTFDVYLDDEYKKFLDDLNITENDLKDYIEEKLDMIEDINDESDKLNNNKHKLCSSLIDEFEENGWTQKDDYIAFVNGKKRVYIHKNGFIYYTKDGSDQAIVLMGKEDVYGVKSISSNHNCVQLFESSTNESKSSYSSCGVDSLYKEYKKFEREVMPYWDLRQALYCLGE